MHWLRAQCVQGGPRSAQSLYAEVSASLLCRCHWSGLFYTLEQIRGVPIVPSLLHTCIGCSVEREWGAILQAKAWDKKVLEGNGLPVTGYEQSESAYQLSFPSLYLLIYSSILSPSPQPCSLRSVMKGKGPQ